MPEATFRQSLRELSGFIEDACEHYDKTAPTVEAWLDDLYIRLGGNADRVFLDELLAVCKLREDGVWMHPNAAANLVYHLQHRHGQDTTGHAGF